MKFDFSTFDFGSVDWSPLLISCKTAVLSTLITFLLGVWAAWWLCGASRRVNGIMDSVFTLPMVLPPTVVGLVLLLIFGKNSAFGRFLAAIGTQVVFSWSATVIAAVVVTFPLMYRTARGAFEQVDPDVVNAARTLGMPEAKVFWRVAMPQAWPGVAAGAVLSFARALGEFGATLMLAGNIAGRTQTIPIAIYFAVQGGKNELALLWMGVIMALSFAVIMVMNALTGGKGGGRA
ncbi:molybdate ABC transporter permease subunit [Beduinella massiliensis]|uniref:molybdate ABC transporter permease subunit n=1 Tax=Beduinella massiliensis TaxID=1852363 RepID=UPI000C846273